MPPSRVHVKVGDKLHYIINEEIAKCYGNRETSRQRRWMIELQRTTNRQYRQFRSLFSYLEDGLVKFHSDVFGIHISNHESITATYCITLSLSPHELIKAI